jgi:hypothetical protein
MKDCAPKLSREQWLWKQIGCEEMVDREARQLVQPVNEASGGCYVSLQPGLRGLAGFVCASNTAGVIIRAAPRSLCRSSASARSDAL